MTNITAPQLELLRKLSQEDSLHLSIYQPDVVLACRINDAGITKGARSIAYNTVSIGSYANIISGEIMLVGSVAGASDLGRVRVKSAISGIITVAENSDVKWANGKFLTVLKLFEILPIFPRIISDPSNDENTIWYKDYDIAYTNQNSILGSFICMGPHQAGVLDDNGQCQFYWSASGTSHVNGDSLTYAWEFEGADGITGSTSETPGYITYKTPGHYLQKLTVTSSGGSVDKSYRYASIYPQNYEKTPGSNLTDTWELSGGQGSRSSGGYVATVTIRNPLKFIPYNGAPVVIFGKHYYGGIEAKIGGAENTSDIFFVGYILNGSIRWDYQQSSVEFQIGSPTEIMRLTNGFSISLENSTIPAYWYEIRLNNVKKSIYHFLRWHSTVLLTNDLQFLATDYSIKFFDTNRESLYDAIQNVLKSTLLAELVSNRQGKLWIETSAEATSNAKTTYLPKFTLSKPDWKNEPNIQELDYDIISYIEMGGVVCNPYSNEESGNVAILACAPGTAPGTHGKVDSPTGLALASQSQLNTLVGNVFAAKNAKHPRINYELVGSYLNLDIAPLEGIGTNIAAEDTSRNIEVSGTYFVDSYRFDYVGRDQVLRVNTELHEFTEGVAGDTIIIPVNPPVTGFASPVFSVPPFVYPKIRFPSFPTFPGQIAPPPINNTLVILVAGYGLFYVDYKSGVYNWHSCNDIFTPADVIAFDKFDLNSLGQIVVSNTLNNVFSFKLNELTHANLLASQTLVFDTAFNAGNTWFVSAIGIDRLSDKVAVVATGSDEGSGFTRGLGYFLGTTLSLARTTSFRENGQGNGPPADGGNLFSYGNEWFFASNWDYTQTQKPRFQRLAADFLTINYDSGRLAYNGASGRSYVHARDVDYQYWQPLDIIFRMTSGGSSLTNIIGVVVSNYYQQVACDPTGQYVMIVDDSAHQNGTDQTLKLSSDYGATWVALANPSGSGELSGACVINMGDNFNWLVCYNDVTALPGPTLNIWRTMDGGITWISYLGDLFAQGVPTNGGVVMAKYF